MDSSDQSSQSVNPTSTWPKGHVVENLYEVREVITSGGMGNVHRVWHREWSIELAVKTPNDDHAKTDEQKANFKAEAEAWVSLGLHPHVVSCVYVRELDGLPRVFAEWLDGGSLHDVIESRKLYTGTPDEVLARVLDIAIQFGWGLAHAHASGLIHQDVKPRNLMLTRDGVAKVSDFGLAIARPLGGTDQLSTVDGGTLMAAHAGMLTPPYCSPEQARPKFNSEGRVQPLTRATDVWSWAISVWEMFTGYPPVRYGQQAAALFAEYCDDPAAWGEDRPPLAMPMPAAVAALLERCFHPDPQTRPRDIGALADELAIIYAELTGAPYPRQKPDAADLLADGLNNHALSMLDLDRTDQAESLWQQALLSDSHHLDAVYNYGLHRWRSGQITDDDLIGQLESVRAFIPSPRADHHVALVHLERRDMVSARELLGAAARQSPGDHDITEALTTARREAELGNARILAGHTGQVNSVALSPDGRVAISGSDDQTVTVWDVSSGQALHRLNGHKKSVQSVAVSGDGRIAVSGGNDKTVRVWDVDQGKCIRTLKGHSEHVKSVAISADGRVAVSGSDDDTVKVWDLASGTCLHIFSGLVAGASPVAMSADARIAVAPRGFDQMVVLDLVRGARVQALTTGHKDMVTSVVLSADARTVVSSSLDGTVRSDVASSICSPILTCHASGVFNGIFSVAMSADSRIAVTGSGDSSVRVWHAVTGICLRSLTGHSKVVWSVAISAVGRTAVSGSWDTTVRVWDIATGACLRTLAGPTKHVASVAVSRDGQTAVSGSENTVRVFDVAKGTCLSTLTGHTEPVESVSISADGHTVISGGDDKSVRVWMLDWDYEFPESAPTPRPLMRRASDLASVHREGLPARAKANDISTMLDAQFADDTVAADQAKTVHDTRKPPDRSAPPKRPEPPNAAPWWKRHIVAASAIAAVTAIAATAVVITNKPAERASGTGTTASTASTATSVPTAPGYGAQVALPFAGLGDPTGIAIDEAGSVYVTDYDHNRVLKLAAGATDPVLLPFTGLDRPQGIAVDTTGSIYLADYGHDRVLTLAVGATDPAPLPFTELYGPYGLAIDTTGSVYVTDYNNNRVLKLEAGATTPTTLPFTGLFYPDGLALDTTGTLYLTDYDNNRVLKLAAGAATPTTLPFTGLSGPSGVAVDSGGAIYVADHNRNRVLKLASGATTPTEVPFNGLDGPEGVAVDATGAVYVSDWKNNRVLKLPVAK